MHKKVPAPELKRRMTRFRDEMLRIDPDWEMAAVFSKINQYYFAGTMQDGVLLIPSDGEAEFFVRRSFERAKEESNFPVIKQMRSYRDAASDMGLAPKKIYTEKEIVPLSLMERFTKHFPAQEILGVDNIILKLRSVKSRYELDYIREAGKIHRFVLEDVVPGLLRARMTEADLGTELYRALLDEGHQGIIRFRAFDTDFMLGQIAFGENSLNPTNFDSPSGFLGMGISVPVLGSRRRKLKNGDLVFIDIGCGVCGYHTDKTMTYMMNSHPKNDISDINDRLYDIQMETAKLLKPGAIPSEIYDTVMDSIEPEFLDNFMGFKNRRASFLGHSIGLQIDELPVIAKGFDEPIEKNMVFAIEPKKGIEGFGMVGTENTFIVTAKGGESVTGLHPGLMVID
ncbi:M24 family metallopeptidase [Methanoplanus limicola]|uniref:Peptidase M24 n=1 Tax=Methanoplanus limicola DSM 2279 TaxID=937775 RepID=H1Z347_9EURY|nr:Xaa-Pro peptidase family protein [Methanoplanus limicola]EHQ35587.1 peptidase M24 [Methanoplanus limicola DSM 2279]